MANKPKWYDAYAEIARFAHPIIAEFVDKQQGGIPAPLIEKYNGDGDAALREWEMIINDIEHGLCQAANQDINEVDERGLQGLELFGKWFMHLWD